ncbi:hypothetical protein ACIA5C_32535 [Actinoplanes sp. NPDC051343]|uniref:hypothetical protein n=1 Tax=Actinoplanes sp. NPDC051343 TaxID=3363906 RepID=UPI0037B4B90E
MIATKLLDLLRDGRWADIREMFAPNLRTLVTPEALRAAWESEISRHGAVIDVGAPVSEPAGANDMTLVRVPVTFERGAVTVLAAVAGDTWLTSLQIAAADATQPMQPWQPPSYADPAALREEEVTRGSRPPNRRSPGSSSWPAARSRCSGPRSVRCATWHRSTRPRPPPPGRSSTRSRGRRKTWTGPGCPPPPRLPNSRSVCPSYWLDLRTYDPAAEAARLDRPMLILQGGRDYQVTVADDLARWQAALAGRADVTFRVHDADDHLFHPGRI